MVLSAMGHYINYLDEEAKLWTNIIAYWEDVAKEADMAKQYLLQMKADKKKRKKYLTREERGITAPIKRPRLQIKP